MVIVNFGRSDFEGSPAVLNVKRRLKY